MRLERIRRCGGGETGLTKLLVQHGAHARLARRRETANKHIESWGENEAA